MIVHADHTFKFLVTNNYPNTGFVLHYSDQFSDKTPHGF